MAKARKAKSSGVNKKSGGSSTPAILVIAAIVVMLVMYGLKENPDWSGQLKQINSKNAISTPKDEQKQKATQPKKKPLTSEKKQTTPEKEPKKKFKENEINAQNGALETVKRNENLPVYNKDDNYYYASSFDFAWPAYTQKDAIIEHEHYALSYNEKTEQADWVAYKLKKLNLQNSKFSKSDDYRKDPDVKTKSATPEDYKGSGYVAGHLAPPADFGWIKNGMSESFLMSNISPQQPDFNQGIWTKLEQRVRAWAKSNNEVYIITGPIFQGKGNRIGKNKVAVPDKFFKVVLELNGKEIKGIGFIIKNRKSTKDLSAFAMSIDEVEKATGLNFFPTIPDQLEGRIEKTYNYDLWK